MWLDDNMCQSFVTRNIVIMWLYNNMSLHVYDNFNYLYILENKEKELWQFKNKYTTFYKFLFTIFFN